MEINIKLRFKWCDALFDVEVRVESSDYFTIESFKIDGDAVDLSDDKTYDDLMTDFGSILMEKIAEETGEDDGN